jgi:hypothetical protein
MILCACSTYFKNLLEQNPAKHPIIILKDVPFGHLTAILEFMYAGEVNVAQVIVAPGTLLLVFTGGAAGLPEDGGEAAGEGSGRGDPGRGLGLVHSTLPVNE